jgi:hypothetical protein
MSPPIGITSVIGRAYSAEVMTSSCVIAEQAACHACSWRSTRSSWLRPERRFDDPLLERLEVQSYGLGELDEAGESRLDVEVSTVMDTFRSFWRDRRHLTAFCANCGFSNIRLGCRLQGSDQRRASGAGP